MWKHWAIVIGLLDIACGAAPPPAAPLPAASPPAAPPLPAAALTVVGIEPAQGDADGGTYVVIRGGGFLAGRARNAKVYFGPYQGVVVRFASDSELVVQAPAGKVSSAVDLVVVFEPGGELRVPHAFTFIAHAK